MESLQSYLSTTTLIFLPFQRSPFKSKERHSSSSFFIFVYIHFNLQPPKSLPQRRDLLVGQKMLNKYRPPSLLTTDDINDNFPSISTVIFSIYFPLPLFTIAIIIIAIVR